MRIAKFNKRRVFECDLLPLVIMINIIYLFKKKYFIQLLNASVHYWGYSCPLTQGSHFEARTFWFTCVKIWKFFLIKKNAVCVKTRFWHRKRWDLRSWFIICFSSGSAQTSTIYLLSMYRPVLFTGGCIVATRPTGDWPGIPSHRTPTLELGLVGLMIERFNWIIN